jgi:hypothetical protein
LFASERKIIPHIFNTINFSLSETSQEYSPTQANPPVDSLWQIVYQDPEDNPQGILDLNETWMQVYNNQIYLKVSFHHEYGTLASFQYIMFLDTDVNPETGLNIGWIGVDYLIVVGDFGISTNSLLLKWTGEMFVLVSFPSYENIAPNGNEFTMGFPLNSLGSVELMSMISGGVNITDPLAPYYDFDYAPDQNFGYFLFAVESIPWLYIEPPFGTINSAETYSISLAIAPESLSPGQYNINLIFGNNQPESQPKIIPVILDYITGIDSHGEHPAAFSLSQNYPNPFNPQTVIHYELPHDGKVTLDIFNILGQKIRSMVNRNQAYGSYTISWDGKNDNGVNVPSGIYIYRLRVKKEGKELFEKVRRMVLIR